jgi:hypothetical protein
VYLFDRRKRARARVVESPHLPATFVRRPATARDGSSTHHLSAMNIQRVSPSRHTLNPFISHHCCPTVPRWPFLRLRHHLVARARTIRIDNFWLSDLFVTRQLSGFDSDFFRNLDRPLRTRGRWCRPAINVGRRGRQAGANSMRISVMLTRIVLSIPVVALVLVLAIENRAQANDVPAVPANYSMWQLPKPSIWERLKGYQLAQGAGSAGIGVCNRQSCDTCSRPFFNANGTYACIRCHSCAGPTGQYNCLYTQNC